MSDVNRPALPKMLVHGLFRRCAWCGGRSAFFVGWFKKDTNCRTCGLNWRRDDVGYELGAAATAAIICMGPLVFILGGVMAITWPEIDIVPLLTIFLPAAIIVPIVLYPSSYTTWQAVDILMRPVEDENFSGEPVPPKR